MDEQRCSICKVKSTTEYPNQFFPVCSACLQEFRRNIEEIKDLKDELHAKEIELNYMMYIYYKHGVRDGIKFERIRKNLKKSEKNE